MGTQTDQLTVSIKQGNRENKLTSFSDNYIYTEAYNNIVQSQSLGQNTIGNYEYNDVHKLVTTIFYLSLRNDTTHVIKLYSLFPNSTKILNEVTSFRFDKNQYCCNGGTSRFTKSNNNVAGNAVDLITEQNYGGVWIETNTQNPVNQNMCNPILLPNEGGTGMVREIVRDTRWTLQTGNQFLYFRTKDINNFTPLYDWALSQRLESAKKSDSMGYKIQLAETYSTTENVLSSGVNMEFTLGSDASGYHIVPSEQFRNYVYENTPYRYNICHLPRPETLTNIPQSMTIHPKVNNIENLYVNSEKKYFSLNPNDEVLIPLIIEFKCDQSTSIQRTMSFDVLTSLYREPTNYTFTVVAKYEHTDQDKIMIAQQTEYNTNTSKYNVIYK
jgi:hypothetical protein